MPPGPPAGSPQACPETKSILGFDIVEGFRRVIDGSLSFVFSSSHLTSSHGRLFRNAHHPGRCADAACGGLEPPPARATPGGLPPSPTRHHFRSPYLHRINPPCSWRNFCHPTPRPSYSKCFQNMIVCLSMQKATSIVFPRPAGEDDLGWASSGIDYLFEVDAKTPAARNKLEGLRRRVSERIRRAAAWLPRNRD